MLGTPLGHPDFVARHLQAVAAKHQTVLDRIPSVKNLQCAWWLLLHCASARANYELRAVNHTSTAQFAQVHDDGVWHCLCTMLQTAKVKDIASLPLVLRWVGSPERGSVPSGSTLGKLGRLHPHNVSNVTEQWLSV